MIKNTIEFLSRLITFLVSLDAFIRLTKNGFLVWILQIQHGLSSIKFQEKHIPKKLDIFKEKSNA